jgi:GNAT superfamily N-acetyltransferase
VSPDLRTLDTDQLVAISGRHPLVRHLAPHRVPGDTAWSYGGAVALVNGYWDGVDVGGDIIVVGPAEDAATLTEALAAEQRRPMSVPAAAYALLPDGVLTQPHGWGFRWLDAPTALRSGASAPSALPADEAHWLPEASRGELDRLIDEAFPEASFKPGSPRVRQWAGIRDHDGRLIACAADTTEAPGVGFVAAITTRPELRGHGLGRRVTGWTLNRLVEREGLAALWHYGGNLAAARVYDALGMRRLDMVAASPPLS